MGNKHRQEQLGKEYEEWLDWVESMLPLPIPEEEESMNNERMLKIRQIYSRLARLEDTREERLISGQDTSDVDSEMTELRIILQDTMNNVCPVIKDVRDEEA